MARHKWNGKAYGSSDGEKSGLTVACEKCGCIKEFVRGVPTYFIDDNLYDRYAPPCDERLIK